jgi:hypothetical protein
LRLDRIEADICLKYSASRTAPAAETFREETN